MIRNAIRLFSTSEKTVFRQRTFSGIQPTGTIHLGNYLGAIHHWIVGTRNAESRDDNIFSIVDLHAITLPQDSASLRRNILEMAASLMACGLSEKDCILFQQSRVPEHAELCWILGTLCTVPSLSRLSQYKEKSAKLKETPLGLFVYPVLQSADILLYKATKVPVGEDNLQNLEIARYLRKGFNRVYMTDFFPEPQPVLTKSSKIKSLRNPDKKMSKSDSDLKSCVYVNDCADTIVQKIKKSVTDCTSRLSYDPETRPGVSNLLLIHSSVTGREIDRIVDDYSNLDTGKYKLVVAEALNEHLQPIRTRYEYLIKNMDYLERALESGNEAAREIATVTMKDVHKIVGFRYS